MSQFRRDVAITLIANLLSKPAWLLTDNLVQNRIGHEAYGLIGAMLGLGQAAIAIADWGLYALVTREMAARIENYPLLSSTTSTLKLLLSLFAGLAFLGIGWAIGYRGYQLLWLAALLSYQLSLSALQFFRAFFQGAQQFRIDALFSAIEKVLLMLLVAMLWAWLTAELYVGLLLAAGSVSALLAGIWVWRKYGLPRWERNRHHLSQALRTTTPFALLATVSAINERINQILLERWVGAYENGLYWGAYRWFSAAMMYLWIVMPLFFARFAQLGRQRSPELWRTLVWGQLVASAPLIFVAGLFVAEPTLFLFLFSHSDPGEITHMSHILQVLALPLLLNSLSVIYNTYLTATGYEWAALRWMFGATVVNALACVALLPTLGGIGAALALGLSYAFFSGGYVWLFRQVAPIPLPGKLLGKLAFLGLGYGSSLLLFRQGGPWPIGVGVIAAVVFFLGWLWILKIPHLWRYASRTR